MHHPPQTLSLRPVTSGNVTSSPPIGTLRTGDPVEHKHTQYEIVTESLEIAVPGDKDSPTMAAHLAKPAMPVRYPGVVVGFEMFGLTGYIRNLTERIARLGYVAIAPDFYHRAGPRIELDATNEGRERGLELVRNLSRDAALRDVRSALAYLREHETVTSKIGMVGCSFGGHIAYLAAAQLDLAATAVFYGGWLTTTDIGLSRPEPTVALTPGITGKLLFLVGEQDHAVPTEHLDRIAARLADAGVRHEVVRYPDTPHGFFCDERDTFRAQPAHDAWRRVHELLDAELSPDEQDPPGPDITR
jgi:carboxymethylenebutenolidase